MKPICIIDDDEDVRAVMCFALEFEGHRVLPLENGKRALELLTTLSADDLPSLIIVDYMMPEMDGIQFINHLRKFYPDTLARIPCALSTARVELDEEIPADIQILPKPLDLSDFLRIVKERSANSEELHSSL